MKQTDRPFPVFLPPVSSLSFSCPFRPLVSVPSTRFVFRVSIHVTLRFVGSRRPFRFPLSFSSIRPFPLHDRAALLVPPLCPRREGMYLTPTPREHTTYDESVCVYPRNPTHSRSCLLPRSVFSYHPCALVVKTLIHSVPSVLTHTFPSVASRE